MWSAALIAAVCGGAACASSDEVAEARLGEERWERAPAMAPAGDAAPVAAKLRFDPGTAALTASARASLERLAARLRAADAGCQLELRSAPDAAGDPDLTQQRVVAVRRHLSSQLGVAADRISDDRVAKRGSVEPASDRGGARCVLVASLGQF